MKGELSLDENRSPKSWLIKNRQRKVFTMNMHNLIKKKTASNRL